jgi:murein DD-endopeptidase MepM/ murein hydrolase activator NlpD
MSLRKRKRIKNPAGRMGRIIFRQIFFCALILLLIVTAKKIDTNTVNNTFYAIKTQFTKEASFSSVGDAGKYVAGRVKAGTKTVVGSLAQGRKGIDFTSPSDAEGSYSASSTPNGSGKTIEFISDKELQVYAAAGGTVSEISDDAGGNKYIKIFHGNDLYSLYGGCTSVYVKALEKVKKGQIIGSVAAGEDNKLKFEIWDGNQLADPSVYIAF